MKKKDYLNLRGPDGKMHWGYLTNEGMKAYAIQTGLYRADRYDALEKDPAFAKACIYGRKMDHIFKKRRRHRDWENMTNPELKEFIKTKTSFYGKNPNYVIPRDQGLYRAVFRRGMVDEVFPKKHR